MFKDHFGRGIIMVFLYIARNRIKCGLSYTNNNYYGSTYLEVVGDHNEEGEAAVEHQGVLAEVGAAQNKNVTVGHAS